MEAVNRQLFVSLFAFILISNTTIFAQKRLAGTYVRGVGVHGQTETFIFGNDGSVAFTRSIKTRASEKTCIGNYQIKNNTLLLTYRKDSIPFKPYYTIDREMINKPLDNKVVVHMNVFIKNVIIKNDNNPYKYAVYDSAMQAERVSIIALDSQGNVMMDFISFSSRAVLELSSNCSLLISVFGSSPIHINLQKFSNKEVFIDFFVYEKYDLPCTLEKEEYIIQQSSSKQLMLTNKVSNKLLVFKKLE